MNGKPQIYNKYVTRIYLIIVIYYDSRIIRIKSVYGKPGNFLVRRTLSIARYVYNATYPETK